VKPIVIDYTPAATQTAGIGRLVREQVEAVLTYDKARQYCLMYPRKALFPPKFSSDNVTICECPFSSLWQQRIWHRLRLPLPVEWFTGEFSIYHATDFLLPHTQSSSPTLLTVHDLSFERVPEAADPRLRTFLQAAVPHSVRRAAHIIADSEATRQDLISLYNCPPQKVSVVLSSVALRFQRTTSAEIRKKYALPDQPFLLCVGTIQPRKNYARVVRALASLGSAWRDIHLVIAGGKGWLYDELYQTIADLNMAERVHFIGFADDDDLPALYSAAVCTVVVSLYEGFGFPVLESMACGTPVIASTVSSLPEVAGDAAILVDPSDVDAIAAAIHHILSDTALVEKLRQRGLAQARRFTPAATAQQLAGVYSMFLSS
jgi:glycosyltransferase involved in cell wall biosynthesis